MKMNKTFFWMLVPVWMILVILNFALPKETYSETEKRELSKVPQFTFPTLLNGEYMQGLEDYVNDHFIARDVWIYGQGMLEYATGNKENNGIWIADGGLTENMAKPEASKVKSNLDSIRAFAEKYTQTSYFMIIPSSAEAKKDKLPPFAPAWNQTEFINTTYSQITDIANLTAIPIAEDLVASDGYNYYNTDHHWTTDGAYIAYKKFCETKGITPKENNSVEVANNFLGTLYSKCGFRFVKPDIIKAVPDDMTVSMTWETAAGSEPHESIYISEFLSEMDKYSYFTGELKPMVTIKTNSESGKKLLVFKDSYFHSLVPYLAKDYSEIVMIDLRLIADAPLIVEKLSPSDYDEILYAYSIDIFTHSTDIIQLQRFLR